MQRQKYVDIVKGICIICVVYSHINIIGSVGESLSKYLNMFISQFFLSAFFIIGGFYLKNMDTFTIFLKNKVLRNYKKLIIYYIPFVLLHNFFIRNGIYEIHYLYDTKIMEIYTLKTLVIKIFGTSLLMGREPILGALWFFVVQIMGLIGLSMIVSLSHKISEKFNLNSDFITLFMLFLSLCFSTVMTQQFQITIPRASIALSIMILIYFGKLFNQDLKLKYNNIYIFFFSITILILNCIFVGKLQLNINQIYNPITFLSSAFAGLYMLCYLSKKIANNKFGSALSICGKYSFDIMVFHFLCFKIPMYLLDKLNIENFSPLSSLVPSTSNLFCFFLYILAGVVFPILATKLLGCLKQFILFRKEKNLI